MKETRILMGMPITVEIVDAHAADADFNAVYDYFTDVDERFSTYKQSSEITKINNGEIAPNDFSDEMKEIFDLSHQTKQETAGYFDIKHNGRIDPSGIVKGWAIHNAAKLLHDRGFKNFYVEAGGDMQVSGKNKDGKPWRVGIRNPFNQSEIIKAVALENHGIATSGTYIRGNHIYNPQNKGQIINEIVSLTVVGPNVYEADRFATAAFAMGHDGIRFIEELRGLEGYVIDKDGVATYTSGFEKLVV